MPGAEEENRVPACGNLPLEDGSDDPFVNLLAREVAFNSNEDDGGARYTFAALAASVSESGVPNSKILVNYT